MLDSKWHVQVGGTEASLRIFEEEFLTDGLEVVRIDGGFFVGGRRLDIAKNPEEAVACCDEILRTGNTMLQYYRHDYTDVITTTVVIEHHPDGRRERRIAYRRTEAVSSAGSESYGRFAQTPSICVQMIKVAEQYRDFFWAVHVYNENRRSFINLYISFEYLKRCLDSKPKKAISYIIARGYASDSELDQFHDTANSVHRHAKRPISHPEMSSPDAALLMMRLIELIASDLYRRM